MSSGQSGLKEVGIPCTTTGYTGLRRDIFCVICGSQRWLVALSASACLAVVVYRTRSFDGCWWTNPTWIVLRSEVFSFTPDVWS